MAYELVNELICRVFLSRDMSHLEHWRTKSYATHVALGSFYDEIITKIDGFIEAHQGLFGIIVHKEDEKLEEELERITDITQHLQDDVKWLNANRTQIAQGVPALENILDDFTSTYISTIYKLRFLS